MARLWGLGFLGLIAVASLGGTPGCPFLPPPQRCDSGIETCTTDEDCADGDPCTDDVCSIGCCRNTLIDCDDGLFCTGTESCNGATGECLSTGHPCEPREACVEPDRCIPVDLSVSVTSCPPLLSQGATAVLAAEASSATGPVTYTWELLGGSGTLGNSTFRTPTFTATDITDVTIQVAATDAGTKDIAGGTATDSCTIGVVAGDTIAQRVLPACFERGRSAVITIDLSVPAESLVIGVQENPPRGWSVSKISAGGEWDTVNRTLKWFFVGEDLSRSISYSLTPPEDTDGVGCFQGRVNLDGETDQPTGGHRCVGSCSQE